MYTFSSMRDFQLNFQYLSLMVSLYEIFYIKTFETWTDCTKLFFFLSFKNFTYFKKFIIIAEVKARRIRKQNNMKTQSFFVISMLSTEKKIAGIMICHT
jgi:hypothetical protein